MSEQENPDYGELDGLIEGDSSPPVEQEDAEQVETPEPVEESEEPEDSESQEQDDDEESEDTEPEPQEKKTGVQKRIDKLTADKYSLKSALDERERKLAEYEAKIQRYETPGKERPKRPRLEDDGIDYDDDKHAEAMDLYFEELADFKAEQKLQEYGQKSQVDKILEDQQSLVTGFQKKVEESGIEDYGAKYDKLVMSFEKAQAPVTGHFVEAIQRDENGPRIVEFFAANPQKAIEVSTMSPVQAGLEIGRISAKMSAGQNLKSKAPPPVKPAKKGGGKLKKSYDDMGYDDVSKMIEDFEG